MTARYFVFACGLLLPAVAFSQKKDYSSWLTSINVAGKPLSILRVPPEEVNPKYQSEVYFIQWQLDRNQEFLQSGHTMEFGLRSKVETSSIQIQKNDSLYPLHFYVAEAAAYFEWSEDMEQQQIAAINAIAKRHEDSIYIIKIKEGYSWINTDTIWVRAKPDARSEALGKLYRLSYVKAYEVEGKPDWVWIEFGDYSGYIMKRDLALRWEDMVLANEQLEKLKSGRYFNFEATVAYQQKLNREAALSEKAMKAANAVPSRKYIRGPKGGCYYISKSGNRQYVDDSFCR